MHEFCTVIGCGVQLGAPDDDESQGLCAVCLREIENDGRVSHEQRFYADCACDLCLEPARGEEEP
jgi:hypothetical protein